MDETNLLWLLCWTTPICQWQVALRRILLLCKLAPGPGSASTQHKKSCQLMDIFDFEAFHIPSVSQIVSWPLARAQIGCQFLHCSWAEILNRWANVVTGWGNLHSSIYVAISFVLTATISTYLMKTQRKYHFGIPLKLLINPVCKQNPYLQLPTK